jgi:putative Mg2+ transporter-C (MgtC) family protein
VFDIFKFNGIQEINEWVIILRIVLATVFGGILGMERTRKRRAAGFRTYILVCISSTVVMMTGQFINENLSMTDPTRMAAQVISGIGFLGAGTILVTGSHQIKGLTTAAGLWAAACMGIAIGIGFYFAAFIMCLIVLVVMTCFDWIQTKFISRSHKIRLYVVLQNFENIYDFLELAKSKNIIINDFETARPDFGTGIAVVFIMEFREKKSHAEVINLIRDCKGISYVEEI